MFYDFYFYLSLLIQYSINSYLEKFIYLNFNTLCRKIYQETQFQILIIKTQNAGFGSIKTCVKIIELIHKMENDLKIQKLDSLRQLLREMEEGKDSSRHLKVPLKIFVASFKRVTLKIPLDKNTTNTMKPTRLKYHRE